MSQGESNQPASAASSASASAVRNVEPTLLIESQVGFEPFALKTLSTIGRDRKNDIVIDHPTTSRFHARIWKDGNGWHYQDLGSANGTKLGDSKLQSIIDLVDGAALRIGRVRAFFFSAGVHQNWQPPEVEHYGKLLRCRCGHIGFAPQYTRGMTLHCAKCGREVVHNDSRVLHPPTIPDASAPPRAAIECAACHTTIEQGERMHTCEECGAQLHFTCFRELGGCATYGCSKVKHAQPDDAAPAGSGLDAPRESTAASRREGSIDSPAFRFAQCGLFVFAGLPTFGVPAIAFGAYRLVTSSESLGRMRFVYALLALVGGAVGFAISAQWWLGAPKLWRSL